MSREDSFKAKKQMNKILAFYSAKLKWMVCGWFVAVSRPDYLSLKKNTPKGTMSTNTVERFSSATVY